MDALTALKIRSKGARTERESDDDGTEQSGP